MKISLQPEDCVMIKDIESHIINIYPCQSIIYSIYSTRFTNSKLIGELLIYVGYYSVPIQINIYHADKTNTFYCFLEEPRDNIIIDYLISNNICNFDQNDTGICDRKLIFNTHIILGLI
jgi:hypothetical protein